MAKGVVSVESDARRSVTYGDLLGDKPFNRRYEAVPFNTGGIELPRKNADNAPPKSRAANTDRGHAGAAARHRPTKSAARISLRAARPRPGHAPRPRRVAARSRSPAASPSRRCEHRRSSRSRTFRACGSFAATTSSAWCAEREWDAVRASRQLKVTWEPFAAVFPGHERLHDSFRRRKTNDIVDCRTTGTSRRALPHGVFASLSASYRGPYQSHGTMAPNCAVADVTKDGALVMCADQGIYQTRNGDRRSDRASHSTRSECSTTRARTRTAAVVTADAAEAAAIMSQEVGKPVRMQLQPAGRIRLGQLRSGASRGDSRRCRCQRQDRRLRVSGLGSRRRWSRTTRRSYWRRKPRACVAPAGRQQWPVVAARRWRRGRRPLPNPCTCRRTTCTTFPNRRLVDIRVVGPGFLRIGPLRAPLDPSYFFAQEGMMDELAHLARLDPYEFRKRNISHPRWLGVLKAATEAAKWTPRVAASSVSRRKSPPAVGSRSARTILIPNQGDRITFAAAVVDIEVNKDNGVVIAKHVYGAMDCGLAINPGSSRARSSACQCMAPAWHSKKKCTSTRRT